MSDGTNRTRGDAYSDREIARLRNVVWLAVMDAEGVDGRQPTRPMLADAAADAVALAMRLPRIGRERE